MAGGSGALLNREIGFPISLPVRLRADWSAFRFRRNAGDGGTPGLPGGPPFPVTRDLVLVYVAGSSGSSLALNPPGPLPKTQGDITIKTSAYLDTSGNAIALRKNNGHKAARHFCEAQSRSFAT